MSRTRVREASEEVAGDGPAPKRPTFEKGEGKTEKYATPIVTVKVGPELKIFKIHRGMLTLAAEYFDKMFKGNFNEALEDSTEFPNDDPDAWTFLIDSCYEGKLPSLSPPPRDAKFDEEETAACWTRLKL